MHFIHELVFLMFSRHLQGFGSRLISISSVCNSRPYKLRVNFARQFRLFFSRVWIRIPIRNITHGFFKKVEFNIGSSKTIYMTSSDYFYNEKSARNY